MSFLLKGSGSYAHIIKYTGVFGGVQMLNILATVVRNKFTALLIGPFGMGLSSLFSTITMLISQATNFGISFSAVRHLSEISAQGDSRELQRYIGIVRAWIMLAAVLGTMVCAIIGPLLCRYVFNGSDHTTDIIMLSPVVGMLTVCGGETAILKALRRLKTLAVIQTAGALASVLISIPVYYIYGVRGIVAVMLVFNGFQLVMTLSKSLRLYPLRLSGTWHNMAEGGAMIRLGMAFLLAGVAGTGAEMAVRAFLNMTANTDVVGLYNAAYILTVTYSGLVFTAMETDYFPRLSAVNHDKNAFVLTANRQIEVSVLIISPLLAMMMVFLPLLVPLLYSNVFSAIVPMAQIAITAMYFNAIKLPVAYMTLAKGHSSAFLILETMYALAYALFTMVGYSLWGLTGAGFALLAAHVFDFIMIYIYAHVRYGFTLSHRSISYSLLQLPLGAIVCIITFVSKGWFYWVTGLLMISVSTAVSLWLLKRNVTRE
ncbi:MAG: oligosaccharide flippase family protein [Prevotella sp.]